jgi:exodeoxyribonuclease V alpha subunit
LEANEPEDVLQAIVGLVANRLPAKYGFDRISDIQVLAPMRRGAVGIQNLNEVLQEALNTNTQEPLIRGGQKYRVTDKVMQLRNNYNKEVFNGDIGKILSIDHVEQEMAIEYDGRAIIYEFGELDEVIPAYAVSIHKYQGSECPCIVMPIHTSHFKLLHRNLLYTGVTRGKKLVILVGSKKAIAIAVRNDEVKQRHTGLVHWLKNMES